MKSDYRVVAACLSIVVCLVGLFWLIDSRTTPLPATAIECHDNDSQASQKPKYYSDYKEAETHLEVFDPNTADSTQLLSLGLPAWTVRSIYKYRAKGGVFSTADDFARMNGITVGLYKRLLPYIRIAADFQPAADLVGPRHYDSPQQPHDTITYPKKLTATERISVNEADTNDLKRVPGIGSYYAKRIVDLRKRYGGFTSLDQLLEIKGLPQEAMPYLTVPDGGIRKININKATFSQMQSHPYIGYARAKVISDYRRLKGNIKSLQQLSLLQGFGQTDIQRLSPYIEY